MPQFKHLEDLMSSKRFMETWVGQCQIDVLYRIFRQLQIVDLRTADWSTETSYFIIPNHEI